MTQSLKQDLVGVTNGTSITTSTGGSGDTTPTAVAGTTLVVDQTDAFRGGAMITAAQGAGVVMTETLVFTGSQTKGSFGVAYDTPAALPSSAWVFCQFQSGATVLARCNIAGTGTAGEIRLATATSVAIAVSGAGIANATGTIGGNRRWIWITYDLTTSPQTLRMQVFDTTGSSLYDSGNVQTNTSGTGTTWDRVVIGNIANTPTVSFRFGRVYGDTTVLTQTLPTNLNSSSAAGTLSLAGAATGAAAITATGSMTLAGAATAPGANAAGALALAGAAAGSAVAAATGALALAGAALTPRVDWFQDFDSTTGDRAFDTNNGFSAPTVSPTAKHDGTNGLIVAETTSTAQRALWTKGASFPAGSGYWAFSVWFQLPTLPTSTDLAGSGANIVDARNDTLVGGTGQGHFQTFYRAAPNNDLAWDLLATDAGVSSMKMAAGAWHYLQCKGRYDDPAGAYHADVQIDGIAQTSITSTGVSVLHLGSIGVGSEGTTQTYTVYFDGFLCAAGPDPIGFLGTPPGVASAAGSLTLAGTAVGVAAGTATGALSLAGAGTGRATAAATGALALAGAPAAAGVAAAVGTIVLAGQGAGTAPGTATASGALSMAGAGTAAATGAATAALSLVGAAAAAVRATASAALALLGSALGQDSAAATGALALLGASVAASVMSGAGALTLIGLASLARAVAAATGALALVGSSSTSAGPQPPFLTTEIAITVEAQDRIIDTAQPQNRITVTVGAQT